MKLNHNKNHIIISLIIIWSLLIIINVILLLWWESFIKKYLWNLPQHENCIAKKSDIQNLLLSQNRPQQWYSPALVHKLEEVFYSPQTETCVYIITQALISNKTMKQKKLKLINTDSNEVIFSVSMNQQNQYQKYKWFMTVTNLYRPK